MTRKTLLVLLFVIIVVLTIVGAVYYYFFIQKSIRVISPNGQEIWESNKTYQIKWKAQKIDRVGIMLVKEGSKETKWIAKDVPGLEGQYSWNIFVWEEPADDYRIIVFEYPWQEDGISDYSDDTFSVVGPKFASCDTLSIDEEWPFLASDYPNLRKAFITKAVWNGNLGGLEGADKKCQDQATQEGFEGEWKALLGDDDTLAADRLDLSGIFIDAKPAGELPEGKTCHQLWGKNFEEFFQKFSDPFAVNQERFEDIFLTKELANVWLGRITEESKRECITIFGKFTPSDISKDYSFTTTCQNWTKENDIVSGYISGYMSAATSAATSTDETKGYPQCYTPEGVRINAAALGGLSCGIVGKETDTRYFSPYIGKQCSVSQRLVCVEQ